MSTQHDVAIPVGEEEIEGIVHEGDLSLGDYPIDTLLIRTESRTVYDVLRRIDQGQYVMDPEFQRDFIWDDGKQSRLIEVSANADTTASLLPCRKIQKAGWLWLMDCSAYPLSTGSLTEAYGSSLKNKSDWTESDSRTFRLRSRTELRIAI